MGHTTSSHRKTFLKGLGCAAIAAFLFNRKKDSAVTPNATLQTENSVQLPMAAHKAPRAVAREKRFS